MNCALGVLYFLLLQFYIGNSDSLECPTKLQDEYCCKGYHRIHDECLPTCNDGCPEPKVCLEPNVCGFQLETNLSMQRLKCSNITNSDTNYCAKCYPTHIFSNGKCIPYCNQKCTNGFCDSSGVCKCNPGYLEHPKTKNCESILLYAHEFCAKDNCTNFLRSIRAKISTIRPDVTTSTTDVTSNCQNDCKDGICIDGLCQKSQKEELTTVEISTTPAYLTTSTTDVTSNCQNDCKDGICIDGLCQKRQTKETTTAQISTTPAYFTTSTTDDTWKCQNDCRDGICIDGLCQKRQAKVPSTVQISNTNSKSIINLTSNCQNNCQHGFCNHDGICKCFRGYIMKNDSGCVLNCDRECVNSICVAPTNCQCHEDDISKLNTSSAVDCPLTCEYEDGSDGCINGTCVAFNKCQCLDGFFPNPDDRFECVAIVVTIAVSIGFPKWLIVALTLLVLIIIVVTVGLFAHKRLRRDRNYVSEFENVHSAVIFQNDEQAEYVL